MTRPAVIAALAVALLAVLAVPASADTVTAEPTEMATADPDEQDGGGLVDRVIGGAFNSGVDSVYQAIGTSVVWVVEQVFGWVFDHTGADLRQPWYLEQLGLILGVMAIAMLALYMLAIANGVLTGGGLLRAVWEPVPYVFIAIVGGVVLVQIVDVLQTLVGAAAAAVTRDLGDEADAAIAPIARAVLEHDPVFGVALGILLGVALLIGALATYMMLLLIDAGIYLVAAITTLMFATLVWRKLRPMFWNAAKLLGAFILAPFPIVFCVGLIAAGLKSGVLSGDPGNGFDTLAAATAMIALGVASPVLISKLFDFGGGVVTDAVRERAVRVTPGAKAAGNAAAHPLDTSKRIAARMKTQTGKAQTSTGGVWDSLSPGANTAKGATAGRAAKAAGAGSGATKTGGATAGAGVATAGAAVAAKGATAAAKRTGQAATGAATTAAGATTGSSTQTVPGVPARPSATTAADHDPGRALPIARPGAAQTYTEPAPFEHVPPPGDDDMPMYLRHAVARANAERQPETTHGGRYATLDVTEPAVPPHRSPAPGNAPARSREWANVAADRIRSRGRDI